jgi:hypothetical protein
MESRSTSASLCVDNDRALWCEKPMIERADKSGWTTVSVKNDWAAVF